MILEWKNNWWSICKNFHNFPDDFANKDFPNEKLDNSDRHTAQLLILSKKSFRQFCALFQPVLDPYQESQVRKQEQPRSQIPHKPRTDRSPHPREIIREKNKLKNIWMNSGTIF